MLTFGRLCPTPAFSTLAPWTLWAGFVFVCEGVSWILWGWGGGWSGSIPALYPLDASLDPLNWESELILDFVTCPLGGKKHLCWKPSNSKCGVGGFPASVPSRSLLEIHILKPHPDLLKRDLWSWSPGICFYSP